MNKNQTFIKCIISSAISTLIMYLFSVSPLNLWTSKIFGSTNLPSMAIAVGTFFIFFFILRNIKLNIPLPVITLSFILFSLFLAISYILERKIFAYDAVPGIEAEIPMVIQAVVILLVCIFICYFFRKHPSCLTILNRKLKTKKGICFQVFILFLLIGFTVFKQYNPNFLYRAKSNPYHHLHAYTNSIYNVFWGQPFTETITSVYGHYAFFYLPLLKIVYRLGFHNLINDFFVINIMLILCALMNYAIVLYRSTGNRFIRLLGTIAIFYFTSSRFFTISYPQLYAHRPFVLSIVLLLLSRWYRTKRKKLISVTGYLICVLIIIWSTECGIISAITWAALHICYIMQSKLSKKWLMIPVQLLLIPASFFAAVLICGLMNVMIGGNMIPVSDFLFPLNNSGYMKGILEYPLAAFPSAWISIMIMLFTFLGFGAKDIIIFSQNGKESKQSAVCFAAAVLGLGSISYAINRPSYSNFFIILPLAAIFISIIADSGSKQLEYIIINNGNSAEYAFSEDPNSPLQLDTPVTGPVPNRYNKKMSPNELIKGFSSAVSLLVLIFLGLSCTANMPYMLKESDNFKNTKQITEICKSILKYKEEDTLAMGNPMTLFYAYLGLDPGVYYMDTADMLIDKKYTDSIVETTKKLNNSMFVDTDLRFDYLSEEFLSSHQVYKIEIDSYRFYFFTPK